MSQPPTNKTAAATARVRTNIIGRDAAPQQPSPHPTEKTTRAASTRSTKTARAELIKVSKSTVRDVRTAKEWLKEQGHTNADEVITTGTLVLALLREASDSNTEHVTLIDTARAVALCLEQCQREDTMRDLTDRAKEEIAEAKAEAMEMLQKMAEKAEERAKQAQERMAEAIASKIKEASENTQTRGKGNMHSTGNFRVDNGATPETQSRDARTSYAQALTSRVMQTSQQDPLRMPYFTDGPAGTKALEDIKAKEGRWARQILVDGIDGTANATKGLTCKELVEKANIAWESLPKSRVRDEFDDPEDGGDEENVNRPENVRFVAAMKLRNGGVVFDCNSTYGIDWLRHRATKQEFKQKFGGSAIVKNRAFTLIVGYLPVTLKEHLEQMGTEIEHDNDDDIREGSVKKLRWMRNPATSWSREQKYAHALITVDDKQTANNIIRNGIAINGERRWVKKIEDEPRRCYKCQLIDPGHQAATCNRPEVCANCSSAEHQTGRCKAEITERKCASCTMGKRENNHASWDRECPVYIKRKAALRDRDPENHFRFYPDEHAAWTWEQRYELGKPGGEAYNRHRGEHPARNAPTLANVIPRPDRRSKQRRRSEEHLDDDEIERGTQALIDMWDDKSDPGDDTCKATESQEEDEEEGDDGEEEEEGDNGKEEEEGQIRNGEQTESVKDMITRLVGTPQPTEIDRIWEASIGAASGATTRKVNQSKIPETWSQTMDNIPSRSVGKKAKSSSSRK